MYPSKLAIQQSALYVHQSLMIHTLLVGVQLSPLEFRYLMVFFSVSENLDVVHQVYD